MKTNELSFTELILHPKFAELVRENIHSINQQRQKILNAAKRNGVHDPKFKATPFSTLQSQGMFDDPTQVGIEFLKIENKESKLPYLQREFVHDFVQSNLLRTIVALQKEEKEVTNGNDIKD